MSGNTNSAPTAAATVSALPTTVRPAWARVSSKAAGTSRPGGELLAESADDEEAVVDGEPEPEDRRQVDGEDGDRRDAVDHPQRQQGPDDGDAADRERHGRRHQGAEHEEQQDERQRHRERLGAQQVVLDHAVDFVEGGGETSHLDRDRAGHVRHRSGDGRLAPGDLVLVAHDAAHDERAVRPSVRSTGIESRLQYDSTLAMCGCAARRLVRARPAAATAGLSTVPCRACTRRMKLSAPAWNFAASTSAAWTDCSELASNPPWESRELTFPPKRAATTTKRPERTRMATRCATTPRARRRKHRSTIVRWASPRPASPSTPGPSLPPYRRYLLTVCSIRTVSRSVKEVP